MSTSLKQQPSTPLPPTPASAEDGVEVLATAHLTPIKYPVRLNDVAVLGRRGEWHRSFMLRPKYGGRFLFLMHPEGELNPDSVIRRDVTFPAFNTPPKMVDVTIPTALRHHHTWQWRLIQTDAASAGEESFAEQDLPEPADGLLHGVSAAALARSASLVTLVYDCRPAISGRIIFEEERNTGNARFVAWSCHQPFDTVNGTPAISQYSEAILHWYRDAVVGFEPHRVWALGDTAYADGIHQLNFTRQVDGKPGWHNNSDLRKDLLSLYRLNYRYHWSFEALQTVMRQFPHLAIWDDHEIRDGYGSDAKDFSEGNLVMRDIARQAAEEYLFQWSPTLRSEGRRNQAVDNHQAYIDRPIAGFIFDGRNSREYGEDLAVPIGAPWLISTALQTVVSVLTLNLASVAVNAAAGKLIAELTNAYRWHNPGKVVSDQQLEDFARFCQHLKGQIGVKYLLMGNSVPFIYILDFLETMGAEAQVTETSLASDIRDDMRDSWHAPANRRQLSRLIDILRDLHRARPDMEFINLSGDIHISNAFIYQPEGFDKPLFQVTSSALTNRPTMSEEVANLLSADGPLSFNAESDVLGSISRLWHEGVFQNFLTVNADDSSIRLNLRVFNREDDRPFGERDRVLTIQSGGGYRLE